MESKSKAIHGVEHKPSEITNINIKSTFSSEVFSNKKSFEEKNSERLEILIISSNEEFQEIEIIYGSKKRRKKITRFLPKDLASNFFVSEVLDAPSPSVKIEATNLSSLSQPSQTSENSLLKEKFLRTLTKINQMRDGLFSEEKNFNYQKFWDGEKRIKIDQDFNNLTNVEKLELREQELVRRRGNLTTPDKAILVAMVNHLRPSELKVDRTIVSSKFSEIADKESFKIFVDEMVELTTNKEKLIGVLFPNLQPNQISQEKKSSIVGYLTNILNESDNSKRAHQMRFLNKIVSGINELQQS